MFRRFLTATLAIAALTGGASAAIRGHDSSPNTQQSPLASDGCTNSQKDTTNAMFPSVTCSSTQQIQVAKAKPQVVPATQQGPAVADTQHKAKPATQQSPVADTQESPDKAKVQIASADPIRGHDSGDDGSVETDNFAWGG